MARSRAASWPSCSTPRGRCRCRRRRSPPTLVALTQPERGGFVAGAERAGQPPRLRPRPASAPGLPDDDRQHGQRRRRADPHVVPPAAAGHRPRGRPRVAGTLVRAAVPVAVRRMDGRRRRSSARSCGRCAAAASRSAQVVETCAYYLNPFEWWAYSRDGHWPPTNKLAGLGWQTPCVRPLSETPRRQARPARPVPPAVPR